jgi:hypothetical protein
MMDLIKRLLDRLAIALVAVAVIALFRSFGGFTFRASLLLGVCFTYVALWVHQLYKVATFKPYGVQFFVNFEALREDLGMVKGSEPTDSKEIPHELYNFTAISAALFVHYREYVYLTAKELNLTGRGTRTDDEYRSAIQFADAIPGIPKFSTEWRNHLRLDWLPRFRFKPTRKGFKLEIKVVEEWWSEYKKFLSPEMQNLPVDYDGVMVLAYLPYGYIPDHVRRFHEPMSLFYPFDILHRRWKSKLAKHGWSFTDTGE